MEQVKEKKSFGSKMKSTWNKVIHNPTFTFKEQLGYSSGIMGNAMTQDVEAYVLTLFLVRFMGIDSAVILILMAVAKIVNIILDPIAGVLLDKTTRKGRSMAKSMILFSPFPLAISSILLFVVPGVNLSARIAYVFVFYLIYCIADGFYDMSMMTISVRMTTNPSDRKNFYTVAQFASTFGGMIPSGFIPIFVAAYMEYEATVYLVFAIVFGLIGLAMMLVPYFTLKEKTKAKWRKPANAKLNFKALMLNKPMWLLIISGVIASIRTVCYGLLAFFYLETLEAFWMATLVGVISVILSYIGIALVPFIGSKLSSRDIFVYGYLLTGIMYIILLMVGYKSFVLIAICIGFAGFPNGAMSASKKILLADSTDYMEYKILKKYNEPIRCESMVFALNSMASRISNLWRDLLLPAGLVIIGYVSAKSFGASTINVVQSNQTLNGIFYLLTITGIVGNLIPALIMSFDNYTGKRKEKILEELNEMRAKKEEEWNKEQGNNLIIADEGVTL
ncbi:MAG: MFS transporter [Herbinix sp.]|nr:MFS transporter [Herbinix sp.]